MDLLTGLILTGVCKKHSPCFEKFTKKDHHKNEIYAHSKRPKGSNICGLQTANSFGCLNKRSPAYAFFLLPVLAHHDEQRLNCQNAGENQVEQDERIRVKGFRSDDLKLSLYFSEKLFWQ